uniref:CCHC-type domain-containing protein n=1 Tax=Brassica oleracea var. oleracea TaxID=109376 RepID=A0A0D2ZVM0_BRAOL
MHHNRVKAPFRRLTPAEIEQWRAAGLCYRCDEKFHRNHKCPKPELTVLIMHDDGEEEVFDEEPRELFEEEEDEIEAVMAEVSINSVVSLSSSRTMKLKGELEGTEGREGKDSWLRNNKEKGIRVVIM